MNEYIFNELKSACIYFETSKELKYAADLLNKHIFMNDNKEEPLSYLNDIIKPSLTDERKKPLIMFHLYGWTYGGAERFLTTTANYLIDKYDIIISIFEVSHDQVKNKSFELDPRIKFVKIHKDENRIERLLDWVRLMEPDVFIGNNNSIPEFSPIYKELKNRKIRSIASCLESFFFMHNHPELYGYAINKSKMLAYADAVVFPTSFSSNAYGCLNENAARIPAANTYTGQKKKEKYAKTLLSVGRFDDSIKRVDKILIVFEKLLKYHPDANLILAGPYDLNLKPNLSCEHTVGELIQKLKIPDSKITFAGLHSDVTGFYEKSDIFIMASNNEGWGLVLTEAACFGLPILAFNFPGVEDIITDCENGFIVEKNDLELMAQKISSLMDDTEKLKLMGLSSQKLAERFTVKNVGQKWDELIEIILRNDNAETINQELKANFRNEISDISHFNGLLAKEYEMLASKIATQSKIEHL